MSEEVEWIHRDRGVLTERDREILMGEAGEDLDQNALNQRRYNIRNRIENAVLDFHLLAERLPIADIRQIFEPAYDWSRERRRLNEQGRESAHPDLSPFLLGWLSLFEFYSYGMHAGGKEEIRILRRGLIENGIERGFRQFKHENHHTYQRVDASLSVSYGDMVLKNNYLKDIEDEFPNDPTDIAEVVMRLRRERKIPYDVASHWIDRYVRSPKFD